MSQTTHTVHRLFDADGSPRYLQPDAMAHLLNCLAGNCKQLGVTFRLNSACLNVIVMEVTGHESHDNVNNTWLRRQAEEFAKGYIAGLDSAAEYGTRRCVSAGSVTIAECATMDPAGQITVINAALERVKQRLLASTVDENIAMLDAALVEAKSRTT